MTKKIFRSITAVSVTVLIASLIIATWFLYGYFNRTQTETLKEELSAVAVGVEESGEAYFNNFRSSVFRFTLVDKDGNVLYDTQADAAGMENHLEREEIAEAVETGRGSSSRYSSTLTEKTFYEAVKLENGNILRVSVSRVTVGALLINMLPALCVIIIIAVAVALLLSDRMAKSIVRPLSRLDLEDPVDNDSYEELAPILTKINKQHRQITAQLYEIKQRADEFEQITASMTEGLVLLDKKGTVLSINSAAQKLFGTDLSAAGKPFLALDRTDTVTSAVEDALNGVSGELQEMRNGREYKFIINPTVTDGKTFGAVILCLDITESALAEKSRREFTANVSHELKTPLQSIIGSAELLENGLVKPEDTPRFMENIKSEASRMVLLINDIIRLSQLDEGASPAFEQVELYELAEDVVKELSQSASEKQIDICVNGEKCVINGIRRYLYEIIYNLCDNAVRYTNPGGNVTVSVKKVSGLILLSVTDTGIGIPAEHLPRIFERFYRVDKSRSKATGGTGLGLSIVKHAAAYHGATVDIQSTVGKGTAVTVAFEDK